MLIQFSLKIYIKILFDFQRKIYIILNVYWLWFFVRFLLISVFVFKYFLHPLNIWGKSSHISQSLQLGVFVEPVINLDCSQLVLSVKIRLMLAIDFLHILTYQALVQRCFMNVVLSIFSDNYINSIYYMLLYLFLCSSFGETYILKPIGKFIYQNIYTGCSKTIVSFSNFWIL